MANLVAVHAARADRSAAAGGRELVVYVTTQTHASIRRGLRILGFDDRQVCTVPVDGNYRLDPSALDAAI
jgi:glutamate/tyrosine decarboxylase-like PLP-dependent enzyme